MLLLLMIAWVLLGIVAGVVTNRLLGRRRVKLVSDAFVGIFGALAAGLAFDLLAGSQDGGMSLLGLFVSLVGAGAALAVSSAVRPASRAGSDAHSQLQAGSQVSARAECPMPDSSRSERPGPEPPTPPRRNTEPFVVLPTNGASAANVLDDAQPIRALKLSRAGSDSGRARRAPGRASRGGIPCRRAERGDRALEPGGGGFERCDRVVGARAVS